MKRISTATKVADKFGAGKHGFTNGNAVGGVPATDLEDQFFDHIQEELAAILEEDGGASAPPVAVDGSARNQVITKLKAFFARKLPSTETVDGTAKVATQAQTDAGADDATIVTPKKARNGFAASFAANGYINLPSWLGGFCLRWGNTGIASASGPQSMTFALAFPTACYGAVLGTIYGTGTPLVSQLESSPTVTGFTFGVWNGSSRIAQGACYLAFGK